MKITSGAITVLILSACACPILKTYGQACGSTTGASNATNFSTATFSGNGFNWSNPGNAQLSDGSYVTGGLTLGIGATAYADYLTIQNFGFSIPSSATICEIHVEVERSASGLGIGGSKVTDHSLRLLKNGVLYGNDLATAGAWPASDGVATYGSGLVAGTWGGSLLPADVNNPNFGVAISAELRAGIISLFMSAKIDQVRVTVIYDPNSTLALSLENFSAAVAADGDGHLLTWTAGDVTPGGRFVVQRSANSISWQDIATIPATDQMVQMSSPKTPDGSYAYIDHAPLDGANFYRIRLVNADGKSIYSTIRELVHGKTSFRCWPNPFTDMIHLSGLSPVKRVLVKDLQGRVIFTKDRAEPTGDWEIPATALPPGLYFLQAGGETFRVLKQAK